MSMYENLKTGNYDDILSEPKKHTREALMRYMNKDKKRSYTKKTNFTYEEIAKSLIILVDNGIDPDDACEVLTAIGYSLLDIEIFKNIDKYLLDDAITTLRSKEV